MKMVKAEAVCDICGRIFEGEFIQHEKPEDDWPDEKEWENVVAEDFVYPHLHYQPTVECHICPECRKPIVNSVKCDKDDYS